MAQTRSLRVRLRIVGLAATSVLSTVLAAVLLLNPGVLPAAHPLPVAGAFAVIAALTLYIANWLRTQEL